MRSGVPAIFSCKFFSHTLSVLFLLLKMPAFFGGHSFFFRNPLVQHRKKKIAYSNLPILPSISSPPAHRERSGRGFFPCPAGEQRRSKNPTNDSNESLIFFPGRRSLHFLCTAGPCRAVFNRRGPRFRRREGLPSAGTASRIFQFFPRGSSGNLFEWRVLAAAFFREEGSLRPGRSFPGCFSLEKKIKY